MASPREIAAMRRALALAADVDLSRDPNPRVGAVVMTGAGDVVGEGAHLGAGTPHAEVVALASAGAAARGGTLIVTLEPCQHIGRTGPCTTAILAAGLQRVVFAQPDPNPLAAGGADTLRAAGVDVEGGILAEAATDLNTHWSFSVRRGRPFVTWKFAATLDGRSAAADGTSRWVTGSEARADVHRLRAQCDTILAGTGTVEVDDPQLTVRTETDEPLPPARQPRRAVMGLRDLPPSSRVLDDAAPTVLLHTRKPAEALQQLFDIGSRHVLLEGGPTLGAAFLTAELVDEVIAYLAPAFLGSGPAAVADLGITTIGDAVRWHLGDLARIGSDVRLTLRGRS